IETAAPVDDARSSDRFNLLDSRIVAGNEPSDRTMTSIAIIMRTEPVYGVQILRCRRVILTDEFIDRRYQLSPGGDNRARQVARFEQQPSLLGVCRVVVEVMHDRSACGQEVKEYARVVTDEQVCDSQKLVGHDVRRRHNDIAVINMLDMAKHDVMRLKDHIRVKRHQPVDVVFELMSVEPRRAFGPRSEEHTSELQSRFDLVCRLLLEKKK